VAAASAGTYTLPFSLDSQTGLALHSVWRADLATADGGQAFDADTSTQSGMDRRRQRRRQRRRCAHAWDPFIGKDRLKRAQAFTQALQDLGANVSLHVFQKTDHTFTDAVRAAGCDALAAALS